MYFPLLAVACLAQAAALEPIRPFAKHSILDGVHINSEGIILAEQLRRNINVDLPTVLAAIRREIPDSNTTVSELTVLRDSLLQPIRVPAWFHQALVQYVAASGDPEPFTPRNPTFLDILLTESPKTCPLSFRRIETVSPYWLQFCVRFIQRFPELQPCSLGEVLTDFGNGPERAWQLSASNVRNYLDYWIMQEHRRLTAIRVAAIRAAASANQSTAAPERTRKRPRKENPSL